MEALRARRGASGRSIVINQHQMERLQTDAHQSWWLCDQLKLVSGAFLPVDEQF